jgi:hypothetical protein
VSDNESIILDAIKDLPGREVEDGSGELPDGAVGGAEESEDVVPEDASDEPTEDAEGLPEASEEPTETVKPTVKVPEEEAEPSEAGDEILPVKGKDGRNNPIPYSRMLKINENSQIKLIESITGAKPERGADGKIDFIAEAGKIKATFEEKDAAIADYSGKLEQISAVEKIMVESPEQFLEMLPHLNPAYAQLIGAGKQAVAQAGAADMPKPDIDLGNGQFTYSLEQMDKRMAWERAQAVKEAEGKINERFAPLDKAARAEKELSSAKQAIATTLKDARTGWEGFKDNEEAIFTAMREDRVAAEKKRQKPTLSLERAYLKVMVPKWKADRQTLWKEWTAQQKGKPTSTSTAVTTPAKKPTTSAGSGGETTIDIIKASIANLKR